MRVLPNRMEPPANRYAVVAGKKVGGAVQRNRAKRLVREALRHLHPSLAPGHDLVVIIRGTLEELPDYSTARGCLDRIVRRAGLVRSASACRSPTGAQGGQPETLPPA
jgi:ribonuclease P protein component